jgi:hypothetical protein
MGGVAEKKAAVIGVEKKKEWWEKRSRGKIYEIFSFQYLLKIKCKISVFIFENKKKIIINKILVNRYY